LLGRLEDRVDDVAAIGGAFGGVGKDRPDRFVDLFGDLLGLFDGRLVRTPPPFSTTWRAVTFSGSYGSSALAVRTASSLLASGRSTCASKSRVSSVILDVDSAWL
jgi:hypothetical protein